MMTVGFWYVHEENGTKVECCERRTRKRAAVPVSLFRYFDFRVTARPASPRSQQ